MSAEILSEHQLKFKNKEMFTTHNVFLLIAVSVPTSKDGFVFLWHYTALIVKQRKEEKILITITPKSLNQQNGWVRGCSPWQGWSWWGTHRMIFDRPCSCPRSWNIDCKNFLWMWKSSLNLNISMMSCSETGSGRWVIMCLHIAKPIGAKSKCFWKFFLYHKIIFCSRLFPNQNTNNPNAYFT